MSEDKPKKKTGRPSLYRQEYDGVATMLCLLGATDEEIAKALDVSVATICTWFKEHPSFLEATKAGRERADARVAASVYRSAVGFEMAEEKIVGGKVVSAVKRYAPNITACMFWLQNRQPARWQDRRILTGPGGGPIQYQEVLEAKRKAAAEIRVWKAA